MRPPCPLTEPRTAPEEYRFHGRLRRLERVDTVSDLDLAGDVPTPGLLVVGGVLLVGHRFAPLVVADRGISVADRTSLSHPTGPEPDGGRIAGIRSWRAGTTRRLKAEAGTMTSERISTF